VTSSAEWLGRLLAGQEPTENDVRQIVVDCPTEHGLVEYKAGSWVAAPKAAAGLREYVAGFANVSGGIIILGCSSRSTTTRRTRRRRPPPT
jgi:predicted HTH transcriptional regulator